MRFLKFQDLPCVINKNFLRLSVSTPISLPITYTFRFLEQRSKLLSTITKKNWKQNLKNVPFVLYTNNTKNTWACPFAIFDCYRHFFCFIRSFLIPLKALRQNPCHLPSTSSHFQLTAKFKLPVSQNEIKSGSKVMY